jgi:hypothetical protein
VIEDLDDQYNADPSIKKHELEKGTNQLAELPGTVDQRALNAN